MLRKYEGIKNHVEALMAEEGEGVSLPETNKREQSTETKEAVRTVKRKKKHHGRGCQVNCVSFFILPYFSGLLYR